MDCEALAGTARRREKVLGIVPARGGSKAIPRKNLALVAGKPLIAWTLDTALRCASLDQVIVSTDDEEIAALARERGAEVPFLRPPELAQDDTPMLPVVQHAVRAMEERDERIGTVVLLQPTSPLRSVDDIEACLRPVLSGEASAAMTVCEAEHNPLWLMGQVSEGRWEPLFPAYTTLARRQDAPTVFRQTGSVLAVDRTTVMQAGTLLPSDIRPVTVPVSRSVDVDSPTDLLIAEVLLR